MVDPTHCGATGKLLGNTLNLTTNNSIGTAVNPISTAGTTITATTGNGGVFLIEDDGANFTATASGAGNVSITNLMGTLNIAGATSTVSGNITLASGDAVTLGASLNAGSGTITIAANTDGVGNQGYDQKGATLTTTNTTASAVTVTVNTAVGGTGDAILGLGVIGASSGGTIAVNSNGGNILWSTDPALGGAFTPSQLGIANGGSNTLTLKATTSFHRHRRNQFHRHGGAAPPGRRIRLRQSGGNTATLAAGSDGIYLVDWNTIDLTVKSAIAQGAGNILLVTANAGAHNMFVDGPVTTGSGSIAIYADDDLQLTANAAIGGPSFSGTVDLQGNRDAGNAQVINMQVGSSIVTTNNSSNAVSLQNYSSSGSTGSDTDLPAGGVELSNITVGSGGTIFVNAAAGTVATRQGSIVQHTGTLLSAGTGTVTLIAQASDTATTGSPLNGGDIGVSGTATVSTPLPILTQAAVVTATTNGTTLGNTGNINIVELDGASFTATTTAAGTILLTSSTGVLTIGGATHTAGGIITLNANDPTGGVINVNATLGSSSSGHRREWVFERHRQHSGRHWRAYGYPDRKLDLQWHHQWQSKRHLRGSRDIDPDRDQYLHRDHHCQWRSGVGQWALANGSAVTVANGATLGGTGTVGASIVNGIRPRAGLTPPVC